MEKGPDSEQAKKLYTIEHKPGAGATTIAMAVLWKLRSEFRCVKLDNLNRDHLSDIAEKIIG